MTLRIYISLALLALSVASAQAQNPGTGSISGTLSYPSEWIPPFRVYALAKEGKNHYRVVTKPDQARFTITDIPPGEYFVVAYPVSKTDVPLEAGAWTRFVQCGMTAQCRDHSLIPVAVAAGKTVTGVEVKDWDAPPGTFPPEPKPGSPDKATGLNCESTGSRLAEESCKLEAYKTADKALNKEYQRVMALLDSQGLPACKGL